MALCSIAAVLPACALPAPTTTCASHAECPNGFVCDPTSRRCTATSSRDAARLDVVPTPDASADPDGAARDRDPAEDAHPRDGSARDDAAPADRWPVADAEPHDRATAVDADVRDRDLATDADPRDGAMAVDAGVHDRDPATDAEPRDRAAVVDAASAADAVAVDQPGAADSSGAVDASPADAASSRDQAVDPCAALTCDAHAHCSVDNKGQASCVCDVASCPDGRCRPAGGCCADADCAGAEVCGAALRCVCGLPLCADQSCPVVVTKGTLRQSSAGNIWGTHFGEQWDLTAGDLWLRFVYDGTGMRDTGTYQTVHAYAQLGVHSPGASDFSPSNAGVWFASDYEGGVGALGPDPVGAPVQDVDDRLLLQRATGQSEGAYNLPASPPVPGANHFFWFDRDGVDPWQAASPLAADGVTYNTHGRYQVEVLLHAVELTQGHAFLTVNGRSQGFEVDSDWDTVELTPAGLTFTADLTRLEVFWGLWGFGDTHQVSFEDLRITGCPAP